MHPKRRSVKLTTVELPFLCFAVERRVKNKFCLLLTEKDSSLKLLFRKENVQSVVCTHPFEWTATNNRDLSRRRYLTSTFAPAASIFFFISSASSFVTPSLIVFGAPSTSAFASAKPSPGTAPRTSLITAILFAPISFKITSNVVFSSAAGAAAPPAAPPAAEPAATATGAAALTPHFSSSCLTNPAISSTDRLLSCSTNLSVSAISYFLQLPLPKAFGKLRPIATGPDSFLFHFPSRHCERKNHLTPSLARPRPPFLPLLSIVVPTQSLVHSTHAPSVLRETRIARAIAPAKFRAPADPPASPIPRQKEQPDRQTQSSARRF